jgi:aspartate kinase
VAIVVQKFGGTSVATAAKIQAAARRAIDQHERGHQVIVVVSAMGHSTDELIALARQVTPRPPARELDMLLSTGEQVSVALMAMAIQSQGVPSISFTGSQIGIVTDSFHTKARIRNISTERMKSALDEGKIVIVAGFQGVDANYNITTLGRGGSDTTAVALAAVLGASACEIFTDVDGVYTTDPRIVPDARKLDTISYDEMLEMASLGAGVMHSRSIEFAKKYGVPIHVRHAANATLGSWIVDERAARRMGAVVTGAALAREQSRITVRDLPDKPGVVHGLFRELAEAHVVVDMIVQNVATDGLAEVSFTVDDDDVANALEITRRAAEAQGAGDVLHASDLAKVSVVGSGMKTHAGVADRMFAAFAEAGINIQMITTSEIKISVLVDQMRAAEALRAVHAAFELHVVPADLRFSEDPPRFASNIAAPAEGVSTEACNDGSTPGMEDLVISDVELDSNQARVTLLHVPDRPGQAAAVFKAVAGAGVNVDMIVQDISRAGQTLLSFSIPASSVEATLEALSPLIGRENFAVESPIAKLSVMGVGIRSHTGVATRMFAALAAAHINISMINTSEVRINVATDAAHGLDGLRALKRAFDIAAPDEAPAVAGV